MTARRPRAAWVALAVVAGAIAVAAIARWIWAVTLAGPVLYGEGAVAHAALLAREGHEYEAGAVVLDGAWPIFTAANYPPLYFGVAGLGDPFVAGRIASIAATLFVAGAIAWRGRRAGSFVALALAAAWTATLPVVVWGAAVKPDLVALAFAVAAAVVLERDPRRAAVAGALIALAVWTKPTAAAPALLLLVWCARQGTRTAVPFVGGAVAGAILPMAVVGAPSEVMYRHVVTWNALSWDPGQVGLLALVAVVTIGVLVGAPIARRGVGGPVAWYAAGAIVIAVLGGREGATVNYLLDLSAAAALLVAEAPALRAGALFPLAMAAQLVLGMALFDPFGVLPGGSPGTGAWGDPSRIDIVRSLPPGPALVEDAGLLVALGREPVADDLFLWSRIYAVANDGGPPFEEGPRLVEAVRLGLFAAIVSETDLERIDRAPQYERARWHPYLVSAVLDRYTLDRKAGALWVYRPR